MEKTKKYNIEQLFGVRCSLNFDENSYESWLSESNKQDGSETKKEYIKKFGCYSVEYLEPVTKNILDTDELTYMEVLLFFGYKMGIEIIKTCMDGETHVFETADYPDDGLVNVENPDELIVAARKYMPRIDNASGVSRGFILTDGTPVDAGRDHVTCMRIPGVKSREHFVLLGNIRFYSTGIEIGRYPTKEQIETLKSYCDSHHNVKIFLDLLSRNYTRSYKVYHDIDFETLMDDLYDYYLKGYTFRRDPYYDKKIESEERKTRSTEREFLRTEGREDIVIEQEYHFIYESGETEVGYGVYLASSKSDDTKKNEFEPKKRVNVPSGTFLNYHGITTREVRKIAEKFNEYYLSTEVGKSREDDYKVNEGAMLTSAKDGQSVYRAISNALGDTKRAGDWLKTIGYVGLKIKCSTYPYSLYTEYLVFDGTLVEESNKEF